MYNLAQTSGEFTGNIPLKADAVIEGGGLFGVDANGLAVTDPTTAVSIVGRAETDADNTDGSDGDVAIPARRGVFHMQNSEVAAVTQAHLGDNLYIETPDTVASAQADSEPVAGKFLGFDTEGRVMVLVG